MLRFQPESILIPIHPFTAVCFSLPVSHFPPTHQAASLTVSGSSFFEIKHTSSACFSGEAAVQLLFRSQVRGLQIQKISILRRHDMKTRSCWHRLTESYLRSADWESASFLPFLSVGSDEMLTLRERAFGNANHDLSMRCPDLLFSIVPTAYHQHRKVCGHHWFPWENVG